MHVENLTRDRERVVNTKWGRGEMEGGREGGREGGEGRREEIS